MAQQVLSSTSNTDYFEFTPEEMLINSEKDALLIVEKAYTSKKALLSQHNLNPDFFDLSSGLAGAVLQKIANYSIKTAFVVDLTTIKSEYFKQLVNESQSISEYRFFSDKATALGWLLT
jgi:hypothetical protein